MKRMSEKARAAGAGALLLVAGIAMGIVVDRTLLTPAPAQASALTVESLAEHIDLSAEEAARLRILLDSLHTGVMAAAAEGPEAMRAATQAAHRRIEATLDPGMRPEFRAWMQEHRRHMMRRMHREMTGR
ncbi:MAG: hypothetical protein WEA34_10555 [Gemmatimonadota bacterium]